MRTRKSEIVSGIAGLCVLAMFIVAIVAGQARANLSGTDQRLPGVVLSIEKEDLERLEALPANLEKLLTLPIEIAIDMQKDRAPATPKKPRSGNR